jgi:hypothetical protein
MPSRQALARSEKPLCQVPLACISPSAAYGRNQTFFASFVVSFVDPLFDKAYDKDGDGISSAKQEGFLAPSRQERQGFPLRVFASLRETLSPLVAAMGRAGRNAGWPAVLTGVSASHGPKVN